MPASYEARDATGVEQASRHGMAAAWRCVAAEKLGAISILREPLFILALILLSGILAGAEIAIIAVRKSRLGELVEDGKPSARKLQRLRKDPERFLATVQIGITVVGAAASVFGGREIVAALAPRLARIAWLSAYAEQVAFIIVVAGISYMTLVLGELVPKSLALRHAERYALFAARPLWWLSRLARPLVWFLTASSNAVLRLFRDRTTFTETRFSPDELAELVEEASRSGTVHPHAGAIAMRALDFGEVPVGDVMVPRTDVVAVAASATAEDLRRILLEDGHAYIPVYQGSLDHVIGIVAMTDALALAWQRELIALPDLTRPPYFVPESMRAIDVLRDLQGRRIQFAIVVDERGGTAGIVTMKDLLEELVGEILGQDERRPHKRVQAEGDGSFIVLADTAIRDANRELPFELPEGDLWSTVGGLCVVLAQRIPRAGQRLTTEDGHTLEVLEASARRVHKVRVWPPPAASMAAEEE